MGVAPFVGSLLVGVLSAFLAFSTVAGAPLTRALDHWGFPTRIAAVVPDISAPQEKHTSAPETLDVHTLPSLYEGQEYGGAIPHVLLDHTGGQRAAILLAPRNDVATTTSTDTPLTSTHKSAQLADEIVNIFCSMKTKSEERATTGSGAFISDTGVILTNAHVAQFLLLEDPKSNIKTTCVVRAGSPAEPKYYADLLYIPPLWVNENAKQLQSENPSGTGERDYALLYVTKAINGTLPAHFPALSIDTTPLGNKTKNQAVIAAGFPAEIIRTDGPKAELRARVATTTITELFTYSKEKVDLIGIAPSAVGESGSSGGPVVTLDHTLIGMISTRGDAEKDGAKSLRAITLPYIDRTIREETHLGLIETMHTNLSERAQIFRTIMTPILSKIMNDSYTQ